MAYLELPNGKYLKVPEGMSPDQAYDAAIAKFPDLLGEAPKAKKGLGAAIGKGTESFLGAGQTAIESMFGADEAAKRGLKRDEALGQKYEEQVSFDKLKEAYEKKGLTGAGGELLRQVPLAIAEQAPNIAATVGSAKLGAMAGSAVMPGVGTAIGAGLGALAPSALQLFGSNVQRQAAEQQQAGAPVDINVGKAIGATAIQAPLDVASTFIPFGGKIAGKVFGKEVEQLLMRGGTEAAEKLAQKSLTRTLGEGVAIGAAAEIPTEITQQMLERYQAGLPLTTKDALKEYGQTAYQAGLLSPLGGVGRLSDRSGARAQVEEKKQEDRRVALEQDRIAKEQADMEREALALGQAQQETIGPKEEPAKGIQGATGSLFGEAVPTEQEVSPLETAPSTLTVAEREAQAATQQEEQVSERGSLLKQADLFDKQLLDIEKQRDAAAEKGDFKVFGELDQQARALEDSLGKLTSALKELPANLSPEMEMAKLRGEQKNLIKQLQGMTGPSYDAKKAAVVTTKLGEIEKRIEEVTPAASQMDLFDPAKMQAEDRQAKEQEKEQRAQEQADLFAQVQPETKKEVLNKEAIDRYQKGLADLEEAYAAGADERVINRLIDALQTSMLERGVKSAAGTEEAGVKPERIKTAIAEAQQDYANATTDEEKAAAIANMGALQKRFATLRAESVVTPEIRQQQAQDAQRVAHDSLSDLLDDIKDGQKPSPNAQSIIANAYTKAAIDDINALREKVNQTTLSNDEALKLAYEVQDIVGAVIRKVDTSAVGRLDASTPTSLERRIDTIKSKYSQGKPLKVQKGEDLLKAGRDPAAMLREATGGKERDAVEAAEKKVAEAKAGVEKVKGQEAEALKEKKRLAPYYMEAAKEKLKEAKKELAEAQKALNDFEPDQKRIAQIKSEVAALKKEDDRIAAEKAKQEEVDAERYAPAGVNPDQKDLFAEKDLEPVAVVRATPQNFQRFVDIQAYRFKQAKAAAERAITEAKERATKAKERADAKAATTAQDLLQQISEQHAFVQDVIRKDTIISDLRGQATRLWQERGKLVKQAQAIVPKLNAAEKAVRENKRTAEPKTEKQRTALLDAQNRLVVARDNLQNELSFLQRQIQEIVDATDSRNAEIEALHKRANILKKANLEREQALLDRLEKAYAKTPEAKNKQAIVAARAVIGQTEAAIDASLKKQIKETRVAEQKAMEFKASLPVIRQEVVATNRKAVGTGEQLARKKTTAVVFPKVTDKETGKTLSDEIRYPVTPKTAEEKTAAVRERAREAALEMKALKEPVSYKMAPKEMAKTIEELRTLAIGNTQKGNKTLANAQLKRAAELQKILKKAEKENVATQRALAVLGNKPGRVSSKAKPSAAEKATAAANEKTAKQIEDARRTERQYASEANISLNEYGDIIAGLNYSFRARAEKAPATTGNVSQADVKKELANIKLPKGLKIIVLDKLTGTLAEKIQMAGYKPSEIRGGVLPDGTVMFVAENHTDLNDVKETIAHELIGHLGVEQLLGESGMKALAKQIQKTDDSVFDLAKKLGVLDDVLATYANARRTKSEEDSVLDSVRELIAHVEEKRPTQSNASAFKNFVKALVGAVRAGLRKLGLNLDIDTNDIYKILRDARKQFNEGSPGAYVNKDGDILYRTKPAVANAGFEDVLDYSDRIVAKEKSLIDKIKGEATGMIFKTKYIDRFAPVQAVANQMKDSLKATQLMYFLRMHDQRMAWTSEVASNGPIDLKQAKDGKGFILESTPGANLADMAAALKDADVGNAEATSRIFTMYLAAKRAKRVGLEKLNFGKEVTQKMLDDTIKAVEANPASKAAFEKAAGIYAEYNKGLVNFAVKTGAIPKDVGAALNKDGDYVPFYRQRADGSVFLDIGGAPAIKIGNLTDQPYLHELVGGDKPIFDVFTSALQNTSMLTDMALRNLATRNTAYALQEMGLLKTTSEKDKGIHPGGEGIKGADIIRFKRDGENYYARVDTDAVGIPAELLVKGLEGVNTSLPNIVKAMNVPANLLRKWVTRNPAYALRQVVRDPLNAVMTTGLDTVPIVSSFKEISKMIRGKSEGEPLLQRRGILGGQVLTGTAEDMTKILRDVTAGKKGWEYRMAQLDQLAIQGDAATRVVMYNNFIKQGLSEMEATLATLESMNFSKRGISPSLFALSTMVPFMNAQIQGLNVMYQAFTGKMPFNEKLKVKQKLIQRGLMMMGFTMLYASLMSDDEAYQNANDDEKYGNWFMPNPFGEEHIKVPIPFEMGLIFKAIPEALVNTMSGDEKARDTMSAIGKMAWNSIPISGPQGIKPLLEVAINHSFFTGREIESARLQRFEPGERYTERTSEVAKMIGGALNISPTKIDYLVRGYTGSLPLAIASLANPILRSSDTGEQPEPRGILSSETPLIGSFFQAKDASGLVNKAYKDMEEVNQTKETYKKMMEEGRDAEADAYAEANADMIAMGTMAGKFRKKMGDITKQERAIRSDSGMSGAEKREALDELKQMKIELAKMFSSARE